MVREITAIVNWKLKPHQLLAYDESCCRLYGGPSDALCRHNLNSAALCRHNLNCAALCRHNLNTVLPCVGTI
jgi:hypothetical protein